MIRNILLWLVGLSFMALFGCAPAIQERTVYKSTEVDKPIPVACVKKEEIPPPVDSPIENPDVKKKDKVEKGKAALQEIQLRRDREKELDALLLRCTAVPK
jgi:hypothetical protein